MVRSILWIILLFSSTLLIAAPIPKKEPAASRMQRLFGDLSDPDNRAECSMNDDDQLIVKLRDGRTKVWLDENDRSKHFLRAPRTRMMVRGDFDASVRVQCSGFPEIKNGVNNLYEAGIYLEKDEDHREFLDLTRVDLGKEIFGKSNLSIKDFDYSYCSGIISATHHYDSDL